MMISESDRLYLFSYGMNASSAVTSVHNYCEPIGVGILNGYHLTFCYHANIEPGGQVAGVVWEIDRSTLASIDMQEGNPDYYARKVVMVKVDEKPYSAFTYMMTPESAENARGQTPAKSYIKHIIKGYSEFDIDLLQLHKALKDIK